MALRAAICVLLLQSFWLTSAGAADCNNLLADIVFILDASGSVGADNFVTMKNFIVNFIQTIRTHVNPNSVRLASVTFSNSAAVNFYLNQNQFADEAISGIQSISYTGGGTNTAAALNTAGSALSQSGARVGVTKLAVLLTDGQSNDASATLVAASSLRGSGVRIMAIGVGSGINHAELNGVASSSSYVHTVNDFSALTNIQAQLVSIACEPVCSWHKDHCWPGDCSQYLAANCQCRQGFTLSSGSAKRCQLSTEPDLSTCRLSLLDVYGTEVRSTTFGTLQHCSNQQNEFMNILPVSAVYHLKADLHLSVGSLPYYVSSSRVGVVGAKIKMTKISLAGSETTLTSANLNQPPLCVESVSSSDPDTTLDCDNSISFSSSLVDGERMCADMEALGGGFYNLQDYSSVAQGQQTFPTISATRRICFTYDISRPVHCSDPSVISCSTQPLQLSTRITRSPNIRVSVGGWLDPVPAGGSSSSASQISEYKLEVHGVDVASTFLSVQDNALSRTTLTGSPPYDVALTLPAAEPHLYAVLLEVHDRAGNVGYARRLVFYDNSSRVVLDPHNEPKVTSANPASNYLWQTDTGDVCLDWRDRFYNDVFFHHDYLLPVKADTARDIRGQYDQITGVLPVSGTPTVRGVNKFEVSRSLNGGPQTTWTNVENVTAQSVCLSLPRQDGETYDFVIRATDVTSNANTDVIRLHVDHSEPKVQELGFRGRWGRAGLYVHDVTDLSAMVLVLEAADPHSGLSSIFWTVGTRPMADDVGSRAVGVQRLANVTSCGNLTDCYCPVVGSCETYIYNITFNNLVISNSHLGDHHRDYYVTVNVTNVAGLLVTEQVQILIDVSPPTSGVAMEGLSDKAEMDFTSEQELRIRWHGFGDPESGVMMYRVVLAQRCLTDQEMDSTDNATEVTSGTSATFKFPSEGKYYTNVVAYNGALTPSPVACSDGITYDTSAPKLLNVSIAHARMIPAIGCLRAQDGVWLVNSNLTTTRLHNSISCSTLCNATVTSAVYVDHLPVTTEFSIGNQESEDFCRKLPMMTEDSWIVLPSDRLVVSWASEDPESQMEEFHVGAGSSITSASSPDLIPLTSTHVHHAFHAHHSGLGQGTVFFFFIRALSKAGLLAQLALGPILVDSTPPMVTESLEARVEDDVLVVSWGNTTFVDLEQPKTVDFEITFRLGHNESFVTSFLPMKASSVAECRRRDNSIAGCAQYPTSDLLRDDAREARSFFFQLHVRNAAGHVTAVNSSSVALPSPKLAAVVLDVMPSAAGSVSAAASDVVRDVDVIVVPDRVCAAWSGSFSSDAILLLGLGTAMDRDDVIAFSPVDGAQTCACVNATAIPAYTRLFSLLKIHASNTTAIVASDGFIAVEQQDPDNVLNVFNGRGCSARDIIGTAVLPKSSSVLDVNLTTSVLLHTGDVVFVKLTPFVPLVRFDNAELVEATTNGYQIIISGSPNVTITLPAVQVTDVLVEVHNCLKDSSLLIKRDTFTATWEVTGPWTNHTTYLQVEVLDRTCIQQTPTKSSQYDRDRCLVAERKVSPRERSVTFANVETFPNHIYTTSVAVCLDDQCLPSEFSHDAIVDSSLGSVTIGGTILLSQSPQDLEVKFSAVVEPIFAHRRCFFQWSISRNADASKRLSAWRVKETANCSRTEVKDIVAYTGSGYGSLYACVQPLFPWRAETATCTKFVRAAVNNQINPFHVIELSHNSLSVTNLEDVLHSQQLGHKLHDLYDLDLDFARSDLLLSAVVTNSYGREITWFLMFKAHLPKDGACAADPDCVTSARSNDGTVTFARDQDKKILQDKKVYYVCSMLAPLDPSNDVLTQSDAGYSGLQEACGDGFVVDDDPPVAGAVVIGNANSGYLADGGRVLVTWSGFADVEINVTDLPVEDTLNYSVALGSFPGGEDLARFTSVGQRTAWTFDHLQLPSGSFCFATVKAEDHVGHVTEVTSEAVVIDNTPPDEGRVWAGNVMEDRYLSGHELHVRWEGTLDLESGLAAQDVAVSQRGGHDDIIPFQRVRGTWVTINGSKELLDGHTYVVLLKSTNRAGLTTLTSSESFVADTSPPDGGSVWNGPANSNQHVRYVTDVHVHSIHWGGFEDSHTGVAYYRVGLGTTPGADDVHPFQYVGLQTAYTWRRTFDQGKWYHATVEACNHAGLCFTSSNDVMFDNSPPTSGLAIVGSGGHHSKFYGHNTTLSVEWPGFEDPQSGIREFRWCVGTTSGQCDVMAETNAFESRGMTAVGLSLPVGTPLYVRVRAYNFAGLSTAAVSDSFRVDVTPPAVVVSPYFLSPRDGAPTDRQLDRSILKLAWLFRDPDSTVVGHTLSVRGQKQAKQAVQPVTMATDSHVTLQFDTDELLMDGDVYVATVTAWNAAGLYQTVHSHPLLVDSTPPNLGQFLSPITWQRVQVVASTSSPASIAQDDTSISASSGNSTISSSENSTAATASTSNSTVSNVSTSTMTTTTTTPPVVMVTQITMAWGQFSDEESGILQYHVNVGRTYSGSELSGGTIRVDHDNSTDIQTFTTSVREDLTAGELLVFSIQAENALGLFSHLRRMTFEVMLDSSSGSGGSLVLQRHSCSPHYCTQECSCAPWGQVCDPVVTTVCTQLPVNDSSLGGVLIQPFIGHPSSSAVFLTSAKCLEGYWSVSDSSFLSNVSRFEVSFSLAGMSAGMGVFDPQKELIWRDVATATSASYCLPDDRALTSGSSYTLHVRAWLSRDTHVTVTSSPMLADHSPPSRRRGGAVTESTGGCGRDVDFVTGRTTVIACWSGLFTDAQSGVDRYELWIGTSPYGDDHVPQTAVGINTTFPLDTAAMLDGTRYYVSVRAWNGAGLATTAVSDGVMKDSTPPTPGVLFAASRHASQHVTDDVTTLSAAWHGFQDLQSGVTSYSVALYDADDLTTPVVGFVDVGFLTKFTFEGLSLVHGHRYQVAAKAIDSAGLESSLVLSPSILVDVTPPEGASCTKFKFERDTTLTYSPTSSFHHELYNGSLDVTLPASGDQLVKVELDATSLQPGARAVVAVNELRIPLFFRYSKSGNASAHHVMTVSGSGLTQVELDVEAKSGASITAKLYTCSNTVVSTSSAVTIRQVSPFAVAVQVTARDPESAILSLQVGVGSTPGGVQVRPLTPIGHGGHSALEVSVQHGSPLYAVLAAQNHAGAWSRFISDPITMDTTAPTLTEVKVTFEYVSDQNNIAMVTAEARWSADDDESGFISCSCELVGPNTTDAKVQFTRDVMPGLCRWRLDQPQNGARVRAIVDCMNEVQILSSATSTDAVVLLRPPDLSKMTLRFLPNYGQFSPYDRSDPIILSSNASLELFWQGADDPNVVQYECRFLRKSSPLMGWSPLPNYKTAAMLKRDAGLVQNDVITAEVRAANSRQMTSEVVSMKIGLDDSTPTLTGKRAIAVLSGNILNLDWSGVFHVKYDVTYVVYAGTEDEYGDVINHHVTKTTSYRRACNPSLSRIYVTVQAVYGNGFYAVYSEEHHLI